MSVGTKATERFSERADDYAAGRPSYPPGAIDALFEGLGDPATLTVVDLGAGTGISTRLLAARGATTVAVEPNAAMRERAIGETSSASPAMVGNAPSTQQAKPANAPSARQAANGGARLTWRAGTAEGTGLPDASADLVTAFQAFHWFEPTAALREIARILRPAGRVALVYNERDESDAFTAGYGTIVRRYATDQTERRRSDARTAFATFTANGTCLNARTIVVPNAQRLDAAGVHARAGSTSYLPREGAAASELHAALEKLFVEHARDGTVTMRMKTLVALAVVR